MRQDARIRAVIEVLTQLETAWQEGGRLPSDLALARYYRDRRFIGSKDRREISRLIYGILRHAAALEWHIEQAGQRSAPRLLICAFLCLCDKLQRGDVQAIFSGEKYAPEPLSLQEQLAIDAFCATTLIVEAMPNWARANLPEWAAEKLYNQYGDAWLTLAESCNQEATLDVRVNPLKTSRADVVFELDKQGISAAPTPHSPLGIRIPKRVALQSMEMFKKGWFDIMDEGSQIAASFVKAKPNDTVIDFCAGAGGKTLAIAETMHNQGTLHAWDIDAKRLAQIGPRAKRLGATIITPRPLTSQDDLSLRPLNHTADWVLVDAPCSGSGTWRRHPDSKWMYDAADVEKFAVTQAKVIRSAAAYVKNKGHLVYVTCSLFAQENDAIVKAFLAEKPEFSLIKPDAEYSAFRHWVEDCGPASQILPHMHGTDGFFIALFTRNAR